MHAPISKIVAFGLLISVPLASAYAIPAQSQDLTKKDEAGIWSVVRSVFDLDARHHTEAQIAAKKAKAAGKAAGTGRDLSTLAPVGEIEAREPHHTEAQIAAKEAAAAKKHEGKREAHHTEAQIAAKEAAAAKKHEGKREAHHTEAQIAAKEAAAAKKHEGKREAHHTEAQIAAKKAAAAKKQNA